MLIERSINANLIVYVDVIVNQAEYQYEVWKFKGTEAERLENLSMHRFFHVSLAYQDREQLMDKPILAWKVKQNTDTKDTKFTINRKHEPEHIFAFSFFFFFMILVMHSKRGKDEHKYFILPSPQYFNSAPSDLYRWSTMFETSSDNFNNLLHELHSRKSTSVCYKKTMLNIDWHDILFLLYFDEFFHDN